MANFPTSTQLVNSVNTVLGQKTYVGDQADAISQLFGAKEVTATTISSGLVTPTSAIFTVDTESSAASDDLSNILTTNLHSGAVIAIASLNAGRVVTVKNAAGGAGQITLDGAADRVLATDEWMLLRRSGTDWVELALNQVAAGSVVTTQGDIIVGDVSGDESRLAIGTIDQVLTSNGTTAVWADPGTGSVMWELVQKQTPSSVASVDFTGLTGDTYDYRLVVTDFACSVNGSALHLRAGTGAGPTYMTTNQYNYALTELANDNTPATNTGTAQAQCVVFPSIILSSSYNYADITLGGSSSAQEKNGIIHAMYLPVERTMAVGGFSVNSSGTEITALRLFFSSGNISSGTVSLYRREK